MRRTSEIGVRQMLPIDAFEALEEAVFVASNLVLAERSQLGPQCVLHHLVRAFDERFGQVLAKLILGHG